MDRAQLRKLIYIAAGVAIVGLLVWIFILGLQSKDKTASIDVQSAVPNDSHVTIDGDKVNSNGKVAVIPGEHKVTAQRDGFDSETQTVSVKQGETKIVRFLLAPNGPIGQEWARDHPDQFLEYEAKVGKQFDQTSFDLTRKYPIISYLPEIHSDWRVDYGQSQAHPKDPNALALIITYVAGYEPSKQAALDWIKSQGFNPSDYEIIYKTPPENGG